jgi:hypothetical protein
MAARFSVMLLGDAAMAPPVAGAIEDK